MIDYIIIGIIYAIFTVIVILTIRYLQNKTITKAEFCTIWAIMSLALGVYGFFRYALFLGPPALVAGLIAIYHGFKETEMNTLFKVLAVIGLFLGFLETLFSVLGLLGVLPQA